MFGGGAGGGKSFLGCGWLIYLCGAYPGTRWLMGRAKLKTLKQTTLNTFFEVCRAWGLKLDVHYHYNAFDGTILFDNGSLILMKDLFAYPADPEFDSLGSLEITGAFIDEAAQVSVKAKNIVNSRMRYKLDENGLVPKLLMTCNPTKNHLYADFYRPWKAGGLSKHRQFVQSLAADNPHLSQDYIQQLERLDANSKERLLRGNWEYDDDPTRMFEIDAISTMFTKTVVRRGRVEERFLTVDVARHGSDKTVVIRWEGLQVKEIKHWQGKNTKESADEVRKICEHWDIERRHVIVDEDGIGGGLVDQLPGVQGFLNGGKVVQSGEYQPRNYANLKSQCYFMLAETLRNGEIGVECEPDVRDAITEELEQIKEKTLDTEGKIAVISKDDIRASLGRSPDFADALMMRMWFELTKTAGLSETNNPEYNGGNVTIAGNLMKAKF